MPPKEPLPFSSRLRHLKRREREQYPLHLLVRLVVLSALLVTGSRNLHDMLLERLSITLLEHDLQLENLRVVGKTIGHPSCDQLTCAAK